MGMFSASNVPNGSFDSHLERRKRSMKFKPLGDRVLVKRSADSDQKSAGGIIIPDTAKEKPQRGEIIAVGPGGTKENGTLVPMNVKKGDMVLFGKYSGTEIKLDGEELLIMREDDVLGILEK
jgi:chaperonin GroES